MSPDGCLSLYRIGIILASIFVFFGHENVKQKSNFGYEVSHGLKNGRESYMTSSGKL